MTEASFGAALSRLWPHAPLSLREGIVATAPAVFAKYGFTPLIAAHFMGQVTHECGAGAELVENGNYSPQGIVRTWPSRFHSLAEAMPFAHNPAKLFNSVYGGRMGNRAGSGDGFLFRGRGATDPTGRDAYYKLAQKMAVDFLADPDKVNDPNLFLECGVIDFILCGCMPFAARDDGRAVTHHLNGGYIGLAAREERTREWKTALAEIHGSEALWPQPAPRAAGQLQYGDNGFEVKGLQAQLAEKGYHCGADDGEFHESTRGAVARLQLDHGLAASGVADQDTKDALQRSRGAPVAEGRATATVRDLRESGSRTIEATDRIGFLGKLKALLGLGTVGGVAADGVGAFDLDTVQGGIDKAQQAAGMLDQVKPVLKLLFANPMALPAGIGLAVLGVLVLLEARRIAGARVDDHRSGANMGR